MNPLMIGVVLAAIATIVLIGRNGPFRIGVFMRKHRRKMGGAALLGLAGLMTIRGLWEPALVPAALGWWLLGDEKAEGRFASLLNLYLDRRFPGWRQHVDENLRSRSAEGVRANGVMTEQEAYEILGLQLGESREAITAAYRAAMKKVHPDQGGAPELAVRLNQARDLLLGRQR